jgi:hypothetical protein
MSTTITVVIIVNITVWRGVVVLCAGEVKNIDWEGGRTGEATVAGEERAVEVLGNYDVQGVGDGDVEPIRLCSIDERFDVHSPRRGREHGAKRGGCGHGVDLAFDELEATQGAGDFAEVVLGHPEDRARWEESGEGLAATGVERYLDCC